MSSSKNTVSTKTAAMTAAKWAHGLINKNYGRRGSTQRATKMHEAITSLRKLADKEAGNIMSFSEAKAVLADAIQLEANTDKYQKYMSLAKVVSLAAAAIGTKVSTKPAAKPVADATKGEYPPIVKAWLAKRGSIENFSDKQKAYMARKGLIDSATKAEAAANAPIKGDSGMAEAIKAMQTMMQEQQKANAAMMATLLAKLSK